MGEERDGVFACELFGFFLVPVRPPPQQDCSPTGVEFGHRSELVQGLRRIRMVL